MRLLQLLHEAKPSSITIVITLYLQLDSCIMPRIISTVEVKPLFIVPLFIVPLLLPAGLVIFPRGAINGGLTVILMLESIFIIMKNQITL